MEFAKIISAYIKKEGNILNAYDNRRVSIY